MTLLAQCLLDRVKIINRKHGKQAIRYTSEAISARWHMKQRIKSPSYTTNISELWTIYI
ncbi:MAG: DUF4113 domain-containing protein [Methylobacter sp.]